jgi:putative ABC transport system permease protein
MQPLNCHSPATNSALEPASAEITALVRARHALAAGEPNDFTVRNLEEMASVLTSTTTTMTWLLASIAAVSLLVGGIGIMNIRLVPVTERIRESDFDVLHLGSRLSALDQPGAERRVESPEPI